MHADRGCGRAADTDIAFDSNLEWKNTRAPGGSTGHSDLYNPSRSTTFVHWHGPRWQPRPLSTSVWPLVPRQTMDMDTDPDCVFNIDPGVVLGWSLWLDVTMALVGNANHSDQCGPSSTMSLDNCQDSSLQHCLWRQQEPETSKQTLTAPGLWTKTQQQSRQRCHYGSTWQDRLLGHTHIYL